MSSCPAAGLRPSRGVVLCPSALGSRPLCRSLSRGAPSSSRFSRQDQACFITTTRERGAACSPIQALLLEPTGDGQEDHLDSEHIAPGPITLGQGLFEIGRKDPADIILQVPTVSTRHAQLKIEGKQVFVTDTGSTNGTFIDGFLLDPNIDYPLEIGSEVVFGDEHLCQFVLLDDDDLEASTGQGIIDV